MLVPQALAVGEVVRRRQGPYAVVAKPREVVGVVVAVVSEGIKTADGHYVCEKSAGSETTDAFGHIQINTVEDLQFIGLTDIVTLDDVAHGNDRLTHLRHLHSHFELQVRR